MINGQTWEDLHIFDITVVSGTRPLGRVIDHSRNARRNFGVLCVWKGETTFYRDRQKKITVSAGQAAFIPKHERYVMEYTVEGTTFAVVNFDMCDREGGAPSLFDGITVFEPGESSERLARTMMKFELCLSQKDVLATIRKKELSYRLLGNLYALAMQLSQSGEGESQIISGVRLLEQTYMDNLPIERFAEASHVSVNTFRRSFQKQFGTSPLKYRNRLRIESAKELLAEGDLTVREVSYAVGFENIGYFCRYYRRVTGETPGETKRRNR